ncbi:MAG: hypothetical protein CMJ18_15030 [Phycisphaeraceae bacterium]|nr:hypothetical protein [Phycisphaeraceae bacterium]
MLVLMLVAALWWPVTGNACTAPPPQPPPTVWVDIHEIQNDDGDFGSEGIGGGRGGFARAWIGIELGELFSPSNTTTCTCGIGFSNTSPFLANLNVTDAKVAVTRKNPDGSADLDPPLPEFDFQEDFGVTNELTQLDPLTEQWFGFSTSGIDSIASVDLEPGEKLKLWFEVEAFFFPGVLAGRGPGSVFDQFTNMDANFGAGSDDPNHPIHLFTASDPSLPEPSTLGVTVIGLLGATGALRRRRGA